MDVQTVVDDKKIKSIIQVTVVMGISRPVILLHYGDDFCWLQFYMFKFLERDAIVFIKEEDKSKIQLPSLPKSIKVKYYNSDRELKDVILEAIDEYTELVKKELVGEDKI